MRHCIERFGPLVWSLARRWSPSAADAEDAVQEIFLDVWKSAGRFEASRASEATFIAVIARRRLIDRRRRQAHRAEVATEDASVEVADDRRIESSAEVSLAARAVAELKPEQQKVVVMAIQHGLSHVEISEATGIPLGTVKSHARRGLKSIRDRLADAPKKGRG